MSTEEKEIIESLSKSISKMTEFEKGYILGTAESKIHKKRKTKEKNTE